MYLRAYEKTPAGIATKAMYAAAEKAEMACALRSACAEVLVTKHEVGVFAGKTFAYIAWEEELRAGYEGEWGRTREAKAIARAEAWLKKYAPTKGWEVS